MLSLCELCMVVDQLCWEQSYSRHYLCLMNETDDTNAHSSFEISFRYYRTKQGLGLYFAYAAFLLDNCGVAK